MLSWTAGLCLPILAALGQRATPSSAALDLQTVLDSVVARHPAILAARARLRAASGMRQTAGQFGNPVLGYEVDDTPFPGGRAISGLDREAMTTLTVPLEPFYQRGPRVKQADALVRAATSDIQSATQATALNAAQAFYRVARAQVRVESTRDVASWLDSVVTYNRSRVREGVAAEADLIRAELERDRISAEVVMQQAELLRARADLAVFVGAPALTSPVVFALNVLPPPSAHTLVTRPDLRAADERTQAAAAGIGAERSLLFRQLGATIGTKQTMGATSMIAGVSVPLPLFDRNRGEIARATAERDAAALELDALTRTAQAQLSGAIAAAQLLTERASALTASADTGFLARADQAKRIALGAYREGAVPLIQVIDAARAWNDARNTYFDLLFAQHESVVDLLYASGADIRATLASFSTTRPR
jgi:cobalt-zinc-cadmium efflux system outer membrane protein